MKITPGSRLRSTVSSTEVVVVRAPAVDLDLTCGGEPFLAFGPSDTSPAKPGDTEAATANELGKRYADPSGAIELLVTKAGSGVMAADGVELVRKEAKPLPATD
ncbi:hypothetical protein PSU4_01760 [Pseudonocardia sulfidoxydans NBRC 16205]|uniref:Uncharacterized protein n=1 Tax=Pseudonocardia sulfidoxydans NBRC 16205 TaxID=1223511 RepID=A0A511D8V8_9PSEU|nr:hypothetical protein [Pseudonocardia sulfidoxydans]GEL21222.1 hypothetical protein PSU4_01760 [Pseudonocardia sulfidoxydans NBRC 16205]